MYESWIYASVRWIIIGSGNSFSPVRRYATTVNNVKSLWIEPVRTRFNVLFLSNSSGLHWRKWIWKCRLWNGDYFVLASICLWFWVCDLGLVSYLHIMHLLTMSNKVPCISISYSRFVIAYGILRHVIYYSCHHCCCAHVNLLSSRHKFCWRTYLD